MNYSVRIETSPGQPIAVVHRHAARPQLGAVVQQACGIVWNVLRAQQVAGAGRHLAIYWDDQINLDVGVELNNMELAAPHSAMSFGDTEVVAANLPTGLTATTTHFGPYGQLAAAHQAIQTWCHTHGHQLAGPNWEIYGHWQDDWNQDPTQIRTDVYYLLSSAS